MDGKLGEDAALLVHESLHVSELSSVFELLLADLSEDVL